MKVKIDERDTVFSKLVRERTGWVCEKCGGRQQKTVLHCSHLFSRRHRSTRWHPDNAFAHCFLCHQYLGENPVVFADWAVKKMGKEKVEEMRILAHTVVKYSKFDLEIIYKHLQSEYKEMLERRKNGEVGRLDFKAF